MHEQTNDFRKRIKLAALLAGTVRKILDQIFMGRPEKIGELKIIIHQDELRLVEAVQQVLPFLLERATVGMVSPIGRYRW